MPNTSLIRKAVASAARQFTDGFPVSTSNCIE
jgi:hypothetical protein